MVSGGDLGRSAGPSRGSAPRSGHGGAGQADKAEYEDEYDDDENSDDQALLQQEFLDCAAQLSPDELREFVEDHVSGQLSAIKALPMEMRAQAFRSLCAEWHPDKCPAIAGLATDMFQRLQAQKASVLQSP